MVDFLKITSVAAFIVLVNVTSVAAQLTTNEDGVPTLAPLPEEVTPSTL